LCPKNDQFVRASEVAMQIGRHCSWAAALLGWLVLGEGAPLVLGQEQGSAPARTTLGYNPPSLKVVVPAAADRPFPINLPTALQLANVRPIDVNVASERIRVATAQLQKARVLWLPTIMMGTDYFRHDGQIQAVAGDIFGTSKSSFMLGAGPYMVFAVSDAIFEPLAARQVLRAREAAFQAARNDTFLAVADAYFNVQQTRGELAGALDVVQQTEELLRRTEKLSPGLVLPVELSRVRAELSRRRQTLTKLKARWQVTGAELNRLLRLSPNMLLEPLEPPHLRVTLVSADRPVDDLLTVALQNRPELARQQALVQASMEKVRQEKYRPFVPSIWLRGASTNPAGTLAGGYFGGGLNGSISNFSARQDWDLQFLWQLENLGFGNQARIRRQQAERQIATLELYRTQDRVAAEVVQAQAEAQAAARRLEDAEREVKEAIDSLRKNFEGLSQARKVGNMVVLLVRPQEAVAAVQALAQAYTDYFAVVSDFNRAQFRLYRALGQPADLVLQDRQEDAEEPVSEGQLGLPTLTLPEN
jgi:outer membrane protein TolC